MAANLDDSSTDDDDDDGDGGTDSSSWETCSDDDDDDEEVDFPAEWGDEVPGHAFYGRAQLPRSHPRHLILDGKVTIPNRMKKIGSYAFAGCSLKEVVLPTKLAAIGKSAFYRCSGLKEVHFPTTTLTAIGSEAFSVCSELKEIVLPVTLTAIGGGAFSFCTGLKEAVLPSMLTTIRIGAFEGCLGLTDVTFPTTLQSIDYGAFYGCTGLLELELPASVHTISGDRIGFLGAFENCTNLQVLILPPALATLGTVAFKNSTANLRMLVVPLTAPAEVAAAVVAMVGPRTEDNEAYDSNDSECDEPAELDLPAVAAVQLVSAPDAVVASLGGAFAEMTTMAEARAAGRAVSGLVEHRYWTIKTHRYHVCTPPQQLCARTLLLVGARLDSLWSAASSSGLGLALAAAAPPQLLPVFPDELWILVLGWLRRTELGA